MLENKSQRYASGPWDVDKDHHTGKHRVKVVNENRRKSQKATNLVALVLA